MRKFGASLAVAAVVAAVVAVGSAQPAAALADEIAVGGFAVRSKQAPVGGDVRVHGIYYGTDITCTTDFGDGHVSTGPCDVRHPYAQPGEYQITQTATSAAGGAAPAQRGSVRVVPDPGPLSVSAAVVGSGDLRGNLAVLTTSGYDLQSFFIEWGDLSALQAPGVIGLWAWSHDYAEPGTYSVRVRVTDSAGTTARTTVVATIR
jgi:hypothetical protein